MNKPFIVYGQTLVPGGLGLNNPALNLNGLNGEIDMLPYRIPEGYNLVLTGWGFEGLIKPFGVCIPWIGEAPFSNAKSLASIGSAPGAYYVTGMHWSIPEDKLLNVYLLNGTDESKVCAWFVQGYLESGAISS